MKDLGGGGITCALSEMAAKGGTGMRIELDKVRKREPDMRAAEIMISESQERMALLINPKMEDRLIQTLEKYEIPYSRIGTVTSDGQLTITMGGDIVASAPSRFVAEATLAHHSSRTPVYIDKLEKTYHPDVVDHLQFGNPNNPEVYWTFKEAVRGISDYLSAVKVACVG